MVRTEISRIDLSASEDGPLAMSYLVATALALCWLALVQWMPLQVAPRPVLPDITIRFAPAPYFPELVEPRQAQRAMSRQTPSGSSGIRGAFQRLGAPVNAADLVRGTRVRTGDPTNTGATSRIAVLGVGDAARTPGRSAMGGIAPGTGNLGSISSAGVARAELDVLPPEIRAPSAGGSSGDATEVARFVRGHASQLQHCYQQEGLTRNAALAGVVRIVMEMENGRATGVRVAQRTWSGAGVAETESCLLRVIRGWRVNGTTTGTITLPFSFTSAAHR
jgi:hypothetical protein